MCWQHCPCTGTVRPMCSLYVLHIINPRLTYLDVINTSCWATTASPHLLYEPTQCPRCGNGHWIHTGLWLWLCMVSRSSSWGPSHEGQLLTGGWTDQTEAHPTQHRAATGSRESSPALPRPSTGLKPRLFLSTLNRYRMF